MPSSDALKTQLYQQLARVAQALASGSRLQLLEFIAQGERSVETLAAMTGLSVANCSKHLQVLRQAGLTIVLTSHSLERGLQVADRIVILARGRLVHDCRNEGLELPALRQTYERCTGEAA